MLFIGMTKRVFQQPARDFSKLDKRLPYPSQSAKERPPDGGRNLL
jgi:hypothetical protein